MNPGAYTSVIRPKVEYAITFWDPVNQKNIKSLELKQKRAARFVCNDYNCRSPGCIKNMIKALEWESLQDGRKTNRLHTLSYTEQLYRLVEISI